MLTRKLLGNWWLWIGVDVAYIGMYASQHLYLTAALQPVSSSCACTASATGGAG